MTHLLPDVSSQTRFSPEKMGKANLAEGEHLMIGLNCFEPGQAHARHAHDSSDKAYYVVSGSGRFQVGEEEALLSAGALVFAPAGVPHGVHNDGTERLVLLVTIAPPIRR